MSLLRARYVRHCEEHDIYVIAKSQLNLLPVLKSHCDEAICLLSRQGIRILLPFDEIATAIGIHFNLKFNKAPRNDD